MEKIVENQELVQNGDGIYLLNGEIFTGIGTEKNNNGIVTKKIEYRNGFIDGMVISYNENGSIHEKSEYKNNLRHGGVIVYKDEKELMPLFIGKYENNNLVNQYYVLELKYKQDIETLKKISESITTFNDTLIEVTENITKKMETQCHTSKIIEEWAEL